MGIRNNKEMTQDKLKSLFNYCPITGDFTRKSSWQKVGTTRERWGISVVIDGKNYLLHRLAWLYVHGKHPENRISHIDGNKKNNAISNLIEIDFFKKDKK